MSHSNDSKAEKCCFYKSRRGEAGVVEEIYRNIILATITVGVFTIPVMIQPIGGGGGGHNWACEAK